MQFLSSTNATKSGQTIGPLGVIWLVASPNWNTERRSFLPRLTGDSQGLQPK